MIRKILVFLTLAAGATSLARAHDPFDGEIRVIEHAGQLEVKMIFGLDAARAMLTQSGLAAREVAAMTRWSEDKTPRPLPVSVADRVIALSSGAEPLRAERVFGEPGESEVVITTLYPKPAAPSLHVRALYYERLVHMRTGVLTAGDDSEGKAVSFLLSREKHDVEIALSHQELSSAVSRARVEKITATFSEFLRLGIAHILTGIDHLLFLCALLLGMKRIRTGVGIISCFTVGHSVTLALAALGWIVIPARIVEPLIAASIMVVAIVNLVRRDVIADRYGMAAGFGLIHGFGFASALRETGIGANPSSMLGPLFAFNLGVEAGQLLVAAAVVPLLFLLRRRPVLSQYSTPAISAVVLLISGYWMIERTVFVR